MFSKEVYSDMDNELVVDVELPVMDADGANKRLFYGIETITKNKFAQNFGGYPRSDIAQILDQQNQSVAEAMLDQLTDFGRSDNPNAGKSDAEIMLGVQSKYMQSPAEILPYIEKQCKLRDERIIAEQEAAAAAAAAEKQNVDDIIDNA